jgi:hypothetical protein
MQARFDPSKAGRAKVVVGLRIEGEEFVATAHRGTLQLRGGPITDVDAVVTAPLSGLSRLLKTSRVTAASLAEAGVAVEGDTAKAKTLLTSVASAG